MKNLQEKICKDAKSFLSLHRKQDGDGLDYHPNRQRYNANILATKALTVCEW